MTLTNHLIAGLLWVCAASGQAWAGKAHTHGVAHMNVALEATELRVEVELPLDTLVGFERAPRTETEREAARSAVARLRDPASLIKPDAAAQCRVVASEVDPSVLEGMPRPTQGHADATLKVRFECAQPSQLAAVEVLLFDAFRRLERVQAQAVTATGQGKTTLRRNAKVMRLPR